MDDKKAFDLVLANAVAGKYPNWTNEQRCELMQVQLPASGYRTDLERLHADMLAEIARLSRLVGTVRESFNRECDDLDAILRLQGLDPDNCRTDGGSLKSQMVLGALEHRDVMTRREARKAERERCATLCDALAKVMTPDRSSVAEDLARAIREDQP
jgi:hypothetical protein